MRWGTDVVKALALGASAVLVGRPQLHALASAGWLGVAHMLHLLRGEVGAGHGATGLRYVGRHWPRHFLEKQLKKRALTALFVKVLT